MDQFYNIGILAYRLALKLAATRSAKVRKLVAGQGGALKFLKEKLDGEGGYIWIHAASLGEFEQGRPLIEMIKKNDPSAKILLTFFSPSGYEVRKDYAMADVVSYLPYDLSCNVAKFMDMVRPKMAIFVKYEFWGNYLMELKRRKVPTYLVSSIFRPGQIFFRPWGSMFRMMLHCFTKIFVQNEESRALLKSIGVDNVEVGGDTRFDRVADVKAHAKHFPAIESFVQGSRFTLVAGSTWEPDEDIIIPYFDARQDMKLILAPHEFDQQRLLDMKAKMRRPAEFLSQLTAANASEVDCVIVDSFGILSSLYQYGDMAYVGGGFGAGIHNINEAAVYGIPVVFGPNNGKFREAHDLVALGGGFAINDADEFAKTVDKLSGNREALRQAGQIALNYIKSHLGATQFIYSDIFANK